jgi:hypothetical protein
MAILGSDMMFPAAAWTRGRIKEYARLRAEFCRGWAGLPVNPDWNAAIIRPFGSAFPVGKRLLRIMVKKALPTGLAGAGTR